MKVCAIIADTCVAPSLSQLPGLPWRMTARPILSWPNLTRRFRISLVRHLLFRKQVARDHCPRLRRQGAQHSR